MKVICIDDRWEGEIDGFRMPQFNEICWVVDCQQNTDRDWYYSLQGFYGWFEVTGFAQISDIDETTFERNYNELKLLK